LKTFNLLHQHNKHIPSYHSTKSKTKKKERKKERKKETPLGVG
jgi:hypothetical protein